MSRLTTTIKALRELGPRRISQFGLYRVALRTGWLRRVALRPPDPSAIERAEALQSLLALPDPQHISTTLGTAGLEALREQASEILDGRVRLFGGELVPLQLSIPGPLAHWTAYETGLEIQGVEDIKFIWEPGRFGWATTLGRAYFLSGDERYSQTFWQLTDTFLDANPPYLGPHWVSAQEVALRLIALVFAAQVFRGSQHATSARMARLARAVAEHAGRIPASLAYARAQNNNHLLSEAAGLYTAGLALPDHPDSRRWRSLGSKWFQSGLQTQIDLDGAYMQHSTNYHRLMLQLGLWMDSLVSGQEQSLDTNSRKQLGRATAWLLRLLDRTSGQVPNLGPNDGAYILPLTVRPFDDFRPVLQAAGQAFLGASPIERGPWDEMALWLPGKPQQGGSGALATSPLDEANEKPVRLEMPTADSWAYFRIARFKDRPGHADQLHLDLWWWGLNLAQDAGTYLYNGRPPWENVLARTAAHNTVIVDGQEQMTWAGRFLWLDWSQGNILHGEKSSEGGWTSLTAAHNGYRKRGCTHQRKVSCEADGWLIEDWMLPASRSGAVSPSPHTFQLHWLLPDWPWEQEERAGEESPVSFRLQSPHGWVRLEVSAFGGDPDEPEKAIPVQLELVRAGECLAGKLMPKPTQGWISPTYGLKIPALSATYPVVGALPIRIVSRFHLPSEG